MNILVLFCSFLVSTNALQFQSSSVNKLRSAKKSLKMATLEGVKIPGELPPVGYFDPLGLSNLASVDELKKWRESEVKHGRIAMLAVVGTFVSEIFHPLFGGKIEGPAIFHFQEIENIFQPFWYLILFAVGLVESYNISIGF
jgi:light-harvesting complex I chlorophyll a/b binding protein 1